MAVQIIILFSITMLAYFVKGITGFGNTLVMNSLFSFWKENRFTTPVDLLLGIPTNTYLAWKNRKNIDWKVVLPLSIAVIAGDIPGILFLNFGSDHVLKVILGIVLILLSIEMLIRRYVKTASALQPVLLWVVGIISGGLMGLFGIGALLAAYISRYTINRHDYRGNLCCVFVADNLFRLGGYWFQGLINRQILLFSLLLVPAAIAGMFISGKIDGCISEDLLKKLVLALLVISGLLLILKNM